jgi:hypothetical protein
MERRNKVDLINMFYTSYCRGTMMMTPMTNRMEYDRKRK